MTKWNIMNKSMDSQDIKNVFMKTAEGAKQLFNKL